MGALATAHKTLEPWGIAPDKIKLVMCDTAITPNSNPAGGSRSQVLVGNAIRVGCEMLLNAMKKGDGSYRTYKEMVAEKIPLRYSGVWTASTCTPCDEKAQGNLFPVYMYGMFVSEVTIDTKTGKVHCDRITCVTDVGPLANKLVVDGQIYGGLVQGVGLALTEDFEDLKKHTSLIGYGLPFAKDAPPMDIIYVETPRPYGLHGAAGVGELPSTSPHASIINAINNACGVRIRALPALPEKVLAGLQAK